MCGIWGFASIDKSFTQKTINRIFRCLSLLSESRGKEAAGIAALNDDSIAVFKRALPAHVMTKQPQYQTFIKALDMPQKSNTFAAIGHSRLVTNGSQLHPANNQPVCGREVVTVHNGIIINLEELCRSNPQIVTKTELDTEIFVALLELYMQSMAAPAAFTKACGEIQGMASTLNLFAKNHVLVAGTNNGSLYYMLSTDRKTVLFASEKTTLFSLMRRDEAVRKRFKSTSICHLEANTGLCVDLKSLQLAPFSISDDSKAWDSPLPLDKARRITVDMEAAPPTPSQHVPPAFSLHRYAPFEIDTAPIEKLQRCTKCVLPETMPFIEFDDEGVCNYCRTYKKESYQGAEKLKAWAETQRRSDGQPDSMVSFSGGRDSSYGLHYYVKELKLRPVAFSYDWGMVTDLARRNQSRMCAKLGIELITVSADISKKRSNIRKNVLAWLKKPDLGMVPLFMAGDKHYFYYANKVGKSYALDTILMAANPFEITHFKYGFCGVRPPVLSTGEQNKEMERLPAKDVLRMAGHYAGQYLSNLGYVNTSLLDTVGATASYYVIPHKYMRLFNYIPWREDEVDRVLLSEYDWEKSPDTDSTWRIGDGTAPFYNYIYYLVAGFTENDTLRSNQIREGMLTREEALRLVLADNAPRFPSMQWYFDAIDLDMEAVLRTVNKIPRLYMK